MTLRSHATKPFDSAKDWRTRKRELALGHSVKQFILGNTDNAKEELGSFHLAVKNWNGFEGLVFVTAGLVFNDIDLINKGIQEEIKRFKRESGSNKYIKLSAISATAWVKLARKYGFNPDASHKLIHQGLLGADTNLPYEDIHELYSIYKVPPLS